MRRMIHAAFGVLALAAAFAPATGQAQSRIPCPRDARLRQPPRSRQPVIPPQQTFRIGVVRQIPEQPPWVAPLSAPPDDLGIAGAELGIRDSLTSGRFLKLDYKLQTETVPTDGDPLPAAQKLVGRRQQFHPARRAGGRSC